MPGPPPQPAELRILKGNGKDKDVAGRKVKRQPKAVNMRPPTPTGLRPDAVAMWNLISPELERMGLLGQVDLGALEAYCRLYDEMHNHPGGRGFASLALAMVKIGSTLGLDPAARLRMTLPEVPEDDEENFAFGG
jgi:phage terminase small subunit